MGKENKSGKMTLDILVSGMKGNSQDRAPTSSLMVTYILAALKTIKPMVRVFSMLQIMTSMMENGWMISFTEWQDK